jgi:anti-sigma factor ChrR (cupin superfamily)
MQIPGLDVKLDEGALPWRSTRYRGIQWLPLDAGGATSDPRDATVLIRMEPGCGYPAHRHVDVEDVLILCGGYADERGEHGPGTYLRYPKGSIHAPRATGDPALPVGPANPACILFAVARGGVENLGGERRGASDGGEPRS